MNETKINAEQLDKLHQNAFNMRRIAMRAAYKEYGMDFNKNTPATQRLDGRAAAWGTLYRVTTNARPGLTFEQLEIALKIIASEKLDRGDTFSRAMGLELNQIAAGLQQLAEKVF